MRKPTPDSDLFRWYAARLRAGALADEFAPFENDPQCGWYKRRLVKGGPFVPARIFMEREVSAEGELLSDEALCCEVNGVRCDPEREWQWLWDSPITRAEFDYMTALAYHNAFHAPDETPLKPIDWATIKPPHFTRRKLT